MATAARGSPHPGGWAFSPTGFLRRVLVAGYEDNISFLASGLAFDTLLWLLPLALVLLSAFGYVVGGDADTVANVGSLFGRFLPAHNPGDPIGTAEATFAGIVESRARLSLYGWPLFFWFSLRLFGSIRAALNDVFDTEETRSWVQGKSLDLAMAVVCAVLIAANTIVSVWVLRSPWLGRFIAGLTAFGFAFILFFIVYSVAPSRRVRWDTALVASLVSSLAYEVAKKLFTIYISEFATLDRVVSDTNALALLLFVLWIHAMAFVFLAGGEVAESYDLARRQREQRALLS